MLSPFDVLGLLAIAGLSVFFYFAATRNKSAVVFFVGLMTVSASLSGVGLGMWLGKDKTWEGIVLICFGLTMLLATMVACVLFRQKST